MLVYTVFTPNSLTAGKKADNQKYDIQNHRDRRQRKWDEVGQYDSKTGDTADRGMAWYQEKIHGSGNDRDQQRSV